MPNFQDLLSQSPLSGAIFAAIESMVQSIGPCTVRVTKSQAAFSRRKAFAWAWIPEQHLRRPAAPLVLTVGLRQRDGSPRWKQVVEPAPGRFIHHLELYEPGEVDKEVENWLREAFEAAATMYT